MLGSVLQSYSQRGNRWEQSSCRAQGVGTAGAGHRVFMRGLNSCLTFPETQLVRGTQVTEPTGGDLGALRPWCHCAQVLHAEGHTRHSLSCLFSPSHSSLGNSDTDVNTHMCADIHYKSWDITTYKFHFREYHEILATNLHNR